MADRTIPLARLTRVAFLDPASGKTGQVLKRTRARSAIVTIGVDHEGRVFVLDAWADRVATGTVVERIFATQARFQPTVFGCEANAMQALFADMVAREAVAKEVRLPLIPWTQPTRIDKTWRIRTTLQPVLAEGRLFVLPSQVELLSELRTFPMAPTVDLVDALASAVAMAPRRTIRKARDAERDRLAAYLRDRGVPPEAIEARLAEYDEEVAAARPGGAA